MKRSFTGVVGLAIALSAPSFNYASADPAFSEVKTANGVQSTGMPLIGAGRQAVRGAFQQLQTDKTAAQAARQKDLAAGKSDRAALATAADGLRSARAAAKVDRQRLQTDRASGNPEALAADRAKLVADRLASQAQREQVKAARAVLLDQRQHNVADRIALRQTIVADHERVINARSELRAARAR